MKKVRDFFIAILIIAAVSALIYYIYDRVSARTSRELSRRIAELSPKGGPPETIDGLRQAIALYEDQIERNVKEGAQTGVYWKILAIRFADRNMHNDALEALERAVYFNSEDPVLFYLTGVSAANAAKSVIGFSPNADLEKNRLYNLSENGYLRALEIDVTYARPMYGLAVLYVFELDRPKDAVTYLERYIQLSPSDMSAMFVLARAHFMLEEYKQAVEIYDRIINRTRDKGMREEAQSNRDYIQGIIYG